MRAHRLPARLGRLAGVRGWGLDGGFVNLGADALPDRFWRRVVHEESCWVWQTPTEEGYGRFQWRWIRKRSHVWTWESANGPTPHGMVLDHICRNRSCVNPEHLRAVTPRENTMADGSLAIAKTHAAKTHCPHGHPYSPENTRIDKGKRRCRTCLNAARRAKRRAS